jgi:hypothetical protein
MAVCSGDPPSVLASAGGSDCGDGLPYTGCPSGYAWAGAWHVGEACNGWPDGQGWGNGTIDAGWMVMCAKEPGAFKVVVSSDDCGWSHPFTGCPGGFLTAGEWHTAPALCDGNVEGESGANGQLDSGWMALCAGE